MKVFYMSECKGMSIDGVPGDITSIPSNPKPSASVSSNHKVKVLLYNVSYQADLPEKGFIPLAYLLLDTYVTHKASNVEAFRWDYIRDDPSSSEFEDYGRFDMVGFSLTYPNAKVILNLLDKWEQAGNRPFIVLGGVLASATALDLIRQYPTIDAVVIGEGEESLLQLVKVCEGEQKIEDVPGIVYRNGEGSPVYNQGKRPIDFDRTPIPKRDFLGEMPAEEIRKTSIRVQTARGCMGGCTFCNNSYKNRLDKVTTKAWRGMSPERVVDEIQHLHDRFGAKIINFVDPSFEDPGNKGKTRIERIARLLLERDLRVSFKANIRAESFGDDDKDLLLLLKRAGMDVLILGIEACTDEDLRLFGKNADADTMTRAYRRLQGMECFFVIVGYIPIHAYATLDSLERSYEYLYSIGQAYSFNIFKNALIPLRGTNIFDKMLDDGLILNPYEVLEVPRYAFVDQRVARVNDGIQRVKINYPILTDMHKTVHDGLNIVSRSYNRMFEGLMSRPPASDAFIHFRNEMKAVCEKLGERYHQLHGSLISMAGNGWDSARFESVARTLVVAHIPSLLEHVRAEIDKYISVVREAGYDPSPLEMRSWGSYLQERTAIGS